MGGCTATYWQAPGNAEALRVATDTASLSANVVEAIPALERVTGSSVPDDLEQG
jgi:hypothetical protein